MSGWKEQYTILGDGRKMGYSEYGKPNGKTVFLFHGIPGSRLLIPQETILKDMDIRLILPERPGMGLSTFQPGRTLLDWPEDLRELADKLGIDRFIVAGYSGGGPYAAACGYELPQRVSCVGLISSISPIQDAGVLEGMLPSNRMGYSVARWMPWQFWKLIFRLYYQDFAKHPEKLAVISKDEPDADRVVFDSKGLRQKFIDTFSEAFRQGTDGPARDGWLLSHPWGFKLQDLRLPVFLWQGEADVVVTPAMGHYLSSQIPGCTSTFFPGEGHLVIVTHWQEILDTLASVV
jgi:pimeloyl-ACP methyl ester carboxylesterase